MSDETAGSVKTPDPNAGRYRHLFRAVLLAIGLGYVFAIPDIAAHVSWDPDSTRRAMCPQPSTPGLGIMIEDEPGGKIRCKLLFRWILSYWSVYALIFLPIVGPMAALRYVMRRAVDLEGPGSELEKRDRIVRYVSVGVLFVYAAVAVSREVAGIKWTFLI